MSALPVYMPIECDSPSIDGSQEFAETLHTIIDDPDQGGADVVFAVGEKRFGGLRGLMSLRSEVFKQMLQGEFKEANESACIPLPQFDHVPTAIRELLKFLHTGKASIGKDVLHLYEVADYFQLPELKRACIKNILFMKLNPQNAIKLLIFMDRYGFDSGRITDYIKMNADVALSHAIDELSCIPLAFINELFMSDDTNATELALFRMLVLLPDVQQIDLAPHIRLPLIPAKYIMSEVLASGLFTQLDCLEAVAFQADPKSVDLPAGKTTRRSKAATAPTNGRPSALAETTPVNRRSSRTRRHDDDETIASIVLRAVRAEAASKRPRN